MRRNHALHRPARGKARRADCFVEDGEMSHRQRWLRSAIAVVCFALSLLLVFGLLYLVDGWEGDDTWLVKTALLLGVVLPLLTGHVAIGILRSWWAVALALVGTVVVVLAFPSTETVEVPNAWSGDPQTVWLLRNFELVSVVGLVSLATILVASLAWARQGRRDAKWQTIPTASQTRTVGLPVTVAAFILAIFSQDVWTVMGRTQAANVVILLLLACLLAMYLASRRHPDQQRFPELTLSVAGTAVITFGIFYASGFLLVDPQTAVDWAGASIDCYSPCDATITGLVGGEQARLAGLFAAVSLVSTVDALSILPPKSSAEARVRERLRGDASPRSRRRATPTSVGPSRRRNRFPNYSSSEQRSRDA